ncbi:DUF4178 domain-containing protein [Sphingomonas sp. ac-8]|uniref:DUF4178 domain-containing protein n=1 Tax=Sphingomonas sp. ac-8 TaxID=3242977 RepID=UPI003A811EED
MLRFSCPNCGASVAFRSAALPNVVCDYCRSVIVRTDDGIGVVGTQAALPFDVSPIQRGTRGRFDDRAFEVIGRVRWRWSDGAWNEWLCLFGQDEHGWLGEAMGQFMMTFERPMQDVRSPKLRRIASGGDAIPGTRVDVGKRAYAVGDAREVTCIAAEGELPFKAPPGWRLYSVDLRSTDGSVATLQREASGTSFYEGRYVTLADLHATDLRAIEGWAMPRHAG